MTSTRLATSPTGAGALTTDLRPARVARPLTGVLALVPGGVADRAAGSVDVTGVTHDSRAVRPGDLYAALPGAHAHGADFIDQARAAGAVAVLTDRPGPHVLPAVVVPDPRRHLGRVSSWIYGDASTQVDVIGVTGTNGKTTTAYLLEAGLRGAGRGTGLIGTVETRVLGERLPSAHTTPEAPDLHALLAVMRERGATGVAMEVSSHGLALGRVDGMHFAAAIFTNLSQDHLDFHADMEDYFRAKAVLFEPARSAVAVVNVDDLAGQRIAGSRRSDLVTTSAQGRAVADWRATDVELTAAGGSFRLHGPGLGSHPRTVRLRLPGGYNVDNALGAIAALHSIGLDVDAVIDGVGSLEGVPGRLERVDAGQPFLALVDYAHSPDSVATVLRSVRGLTTGRVIVVLGCGGDRDRDKRPKMGEAAARGADLVVITSDNPRSEDPLAIIAAVERGAAAVGTPLVVEPDRTAAIRAAVSAAVAGDVLVVAGKGHEQGQILADRTVPFDDREVLRVALEELGR
ncbi:MAG TPA: UDP-N-acetylmuramoyl-L-alanyl-D-glutamate--2,6-diaminopimelate ligase [Mycobacteriales bacterium]|nr:UDP-N-acetylmuramoyl-L-alanyl-D-glutamate--2,6-diaminopimelate ligase [Mycobacteriales bacterium]